jgi:hypothetical protein
VQPGQMNSTPMDSTRAQSFVIKLWIEPGAYRQVWRGQISHVAEFDAPVRLPLRSLFDIPDFIAPYLEDLGANPGWWWSLRRRWRSHLRTIRGGV